MSNNNDNLWMNWKKLWKRAQQEDATLVQPRVSHDGSESTGSASSNSGFSAKVQSAPELTLAATDTILAHGSAETVVFECEWDRQWDSFRSRAKALNGSERHEVIELTRVLMEWLKRLAEILLDDNGLSIQSESTSRREAIRRLFERNLFLKPFEVFSIGVLASEFLQWTRIRPEVFSLAVLQHCRLVSNEQFTQFLAAFECDRVEFLAARNYLADLIDVHGKFDKDARGRQHAR